MAHEAETNTELHELAKSIGALGDLQPILGVNCLCEILADIARALDLVADGHEVTMVIRKGAALEITIDGKKVER